MQDYELIDPQGREGLRQWLSENHGRSKSVWLVRWKKDSGGPYVSHGDIVNELLCFGWIDSSVRRLDDKRSRLLISPRKPKSNWSRVNKNKVQLLSKAGLIHAAGQAKIDAARKDGSWEFLDDVENLFQPDDLVAAFEEHAGAQENWDAFPRSNKRAILEWIKTAKTAPTREKRISETARLAAKNIRALSPDAKGQ